jgi:hypothetical protein
MVHTFPISLISGYSVRGRYDMDTAVIFLEKAVNWNANPNIRPICLPPGGKIENFIGKPAMVTGWGLKGNGRAASVLQKGPVLAIFVKTFFNQMLQKLRPHWGENSTAHLNTMCFRKAGFDLLLHYIQS